MKITVVSVGKLKEKYLKEGVGEYSKRLSRFCDLNMVEVADEQAPDSLSPMQEEQIKQREGARILEKAGTKAGGTAKAGGTVLFALDVKGERYTSEGFANMLKKCFLGGKSNITFVIGGSLGISKEVIDRADYRISLSDMTFPHQLTRLILLEQLFRAFKIINGETYHK